MNLTDTPNPDEGKDTKREKFIDGVLGSNLSEDKYNRLKKKKHLNSYE